MRSWPVSKNAHVFIIDILCFTDLVELSLICTTCGMGVGLLLPVLQCCRCCLFVCLICHSQLAANTQFLKVPPPPPPTQSPAVQCGLFIQFSVFSRLFHFSFCQFRFHFSFCQFRLLLFFFFFHFTNVEEQPKVAHVASISFSDTFTTQVRDSSLLSVIMLPALLIRQRHC